MSKEKPSKIKPNKSAVWLFHFLNESCSTTFLNKTESAKRAKYNATSEDSFRAIGCQNFTKLSDKITEWLDEHGLSENALKAKLLSLIEAKETKFFQKDGKVTDTREVEALEVQRRTLDMALKLKGLYAPEKYEHTMSEKMMAFMAKMKHKEKHGAPGIKDN